MAALPLRESAKASRTACINQVRQIALGVRMYADDSGDDRGPVLNSGGPVDGWTAYKKLIQNHLTRSDKLFSCPSDTYHYDFTVNSPNAYDYVNQGIHQQPWTEYSSYGFNGGNTRTNRRTGTTYPGIAGRQLNSIQNPTITILVAEIPAFYGYSWHEPKNPRLPHYYNDARNVAGFVDGNVGYLKFYWDISKPQSEAWEYDPPAAYGYKWSAN